MDLTDNITKVASRKRMNADAHKLKEKVFHETAKVIKLRVAQDATYWDMKEKLQTVEAEHERLQRNMLDVSMQHEALSAAHQQELRRRPETLNKLVSTREMCDVLEQHSERVRASLRRAAADRAALATYYDAAARRVQQVTDAHAHAAQQAQLSTHALSEKLKVSEEHGARLSKCASEAQRQAEAAVGAAREQVRAGADELRGIRAEAAATIARLEAGIADRDKAIGELHRDAQRQAEAARVAALDQTRASAAVADEMRAHRAELGERIARLHAALEDRDKIVTELTCEVERNAVKAGAEAARAQQTIANLQREMESHVAAAAASEARAADALSASEARVKLLSEESTQLRVAVQNLETESVGLKREIESSGSKNDALEKEIEIKKNEMCVVESCLEETRRSLEEIRAALTAAEGSLEEARDALSAERDARHNEHAAAEEKMRAHLEASAAAAAEAQRELAERAGTIGQLMSDAADQLRARARSDAALAIACQQLEEAVGARDTANENLRHLEHKIRGKEEELQAQMKIILETRNENERLKNEIRGIKDSIDNAEKELRRYRTDAAAAGAASNTVRREPPEHDDNALHAPPEPLAQVKQRPRMNPNDQDSLNFQFSLDSCSEYSDALDPEKVDARFNAMMRGSTTPITLQSLKMKRRRNDPAQGGMKARAEVKSSPPQDNRRFFKNKRPRRDDAKTKNQKKLTNNISIE